MKDKHGQGSSWLKGIIGSSIKGKADLVFKLCYKNFHIYKKKCGLIKGNTECLAVIIKDTILFVQVLFTCFNISTRKS